MMNAKTLELGEQIVEWDEVEREEAWAISLVAAGFTVDAVSKMSPLGEARTRELLVGRTTPSVGAPTTAGRRPSM